MTTEPADNPAPTKKQNRAWRLVKSLLRIAVVAYVGLAVVLFFGQSRIVYQPSRDMMGTPEMWFSAIRARASSMERSGPSVTGSVIMPDSLRFTRCT